MQKMKLPKLLDSYQRFGPYSRWVATQQIVWMLMCIFSGCLAVYFLQAGWLVVPLSAFGGWITTGFVDMVVSNFVPREIIVKELYAQYENPKAETVQINPTGYSYNLSDLIKQLDIERSMENANEVALEHLNEALNTISTMYIGEDLNVEEKQKALNYMQTIRDQICKQQGKQPHLFSWHATRELSDYHTTEFENGEAVICPTRLKVLNVDTGKVHLFELVAPWRNGEIMTGKQMAQHIVSAGRTYVSTHVDVEFIDTHGERSSETLKLTYMMPQED